MHGPTCIFWANLIPFSLQGISLSIACGVGHIPSGDQSACIACEDTETSSFDEEWGKYKCIACPVGRAGLQCERCLPGYFALRSLGPHEPCIMCTELELPARRKDLDITEPQLVGGSVCPGGVPGLTAGICPMHGMWVHTTESETRPQILVCESADACVKLASRDQRAEEYGNVVASADSPCHAWINGSADGAQPGAVCGEGYAGFLCSTCEVGTSKVDGKCLPCPGFDYGMLGLMVATNFLTALFLLHKSTKATVSKHEVEDIWYKVDLARTDILDVGGIGKALDLMGMHVPDPKVVAEMMKKDFGAKQGKVHKDDFVLARSQEAPTAALGTAIFFIQTFSLLAKGAIDLQAGEMLNMDAEATVGSCVSPLSKTAASAARPLHSITPVGHNCHNRIPLTLSFIVDYVQRFVLKVFATPAMLFLGILVAVPIWNFLRRLPCLRALWKRLHAPPKIEIVHAQRAALNAFLFCFAPLTRAAVEALVCRRACDGDDPRCDPILAKDMGVPSDLLAIADPELLLGVWA
jgi:hypothetical protein